jgi:uncharacterized protein YkwD
MPPTRRFALCALVLCSLVIPADVRAQDMIDELNRVRAQHDLRPLQASPGLEESASAHARRILGSGSFAHAETIVAPTRFRALGEALSMHYGHRLLRARTVRRWLRSPVHRALVLRPGFGWAGAGYVRGRFRGRRATIWVLHLGA